MRHRGWAPDERRYGPDHRETALAHIHVGSTLGDLGRYALAIAEQRRAIAIVEMMDPENIEVGELSAGLGQTLSRAGDHDGALAAFARALPILEAELGADHADVAEAHGHHAEALLAARRWREAATEADRALTRGRAGRGPK